MYKHKNINIYVCVCMSVCEHIYLHNCCIVDMSYIIRETNAATVYPKVHGHLLKGRAGAGMYRQNKKTHTAATETMRTTSV